MQKIFFLSFVLLLISANSVAQIRVATAANLALPMQEIKVAFEKKYAEKVEIIAAASGVLCTQIQQGAPFDVFLSADMTYPEVLSKKKLTMQSPKSFTLGRLVVWSKKKTNINELIAFLASANIQTIAVAQPTLAPYGAEAISYLKNNKLLAKVKSKLVYGESIGKVNQYIAAGVVDVAFTANSAIFAEELKDKGFWIEIPHNVGIPHGAVVIKSTAKAKIAQLFYEYLFSEEVKVILKKFGYTS